jgi:hypothetical protein
LPVVAGCAAPVKTSFTPEMEAAALAALQPGEGRILGQAFVQSGKGKVIPAAGQVFGLIPKTPYADERIRRAYGNEKWRRPIVLGLGAADPRFGAAVRETKADKHGDFEFDKVKDGSYYVEGAAQNDEETFYVYDTVEVRGGGIAHVYLSGH